MTFWRQQFPALLWVTIVFISSSIPAASLPDSTLWRLDKLIHFGVYFVMTLLTYRAFKGQTRFPWLALHAIPCAVIFTVAFGFADEWHQSFVAGRTQSLLDAIADSAGGLAAAGVVALLNLRRRTA